MDSIFDKTIPELKSLTELRRWGVGERLDHRKLNEPVHALNRMIRGVDAARQKTFTKAPIAAAQFRFVSLKKDYLLANTWDGVDAGDEDIAIALPYLLRRTPFHSQERDGITYAYFGFKLRKATRDDEVEWQIIIEPYLAGDLIYAMPSVDGGTSVTRTVGDDEVAVEWLELNQGRAWAREFVQR